MLVSGPAHPYQANKQLADAAPATHRCTENVQAEDWLKQSRDQFRLRQVMQEHVLSGCGVVYGWVHVPAHDDLSPVRLNAPCVTAVFFYLASIFAWSAAAVLRNRSVAATVAPCGPVL